MAGHLWGAKCKMKILRDFLVQFWKLGLPINRPLVSEIFFGENRKMQPYYGQFSSHPSSPKSEPSLYHKTEIFHPKTSN